MTVEFDADAQEVGDRRELIMALSSDVDRQLGSVSDRTTSQGTRAAILVASASISTALPAGNLPDPLYVAALACAAASALCGVIVILPRVGHEVPIHDVEVDAWNLSPTMALRRVMYEKVAVLTHDEKAMKWRRFVLLGGFALLALALCFSAIHLAIDWSHDIGRTTTQSVTSPGTP